MWDKIEVCQPAESLSILQAFNLSFHECVCVCVCGVCVCVCVWVIVVRACVCVYDFRSFNACVWMMYISQKGSFNTCIHVWLLLLMCVYVLSWL